MESELADKFDEWLKSQFWGECFKDDKNIKAAFMAGAQSREHNSQRLYNAIHTPIMEKRVEVRRLDGMIHRREFEDVLIKLNQEIWREVTSVLNLKR